MFDFGQFIDRAISIVSPSWAASRSTARLHYKASIVNHSSMDQLLQSGGQDGYQAGRSDRTTRRYMGRAQNENSIDRNNLANTRRRAWTHYRDNPQSKKAVRNLKSKVLGKCIEPQSLATMPDGTPHKAFREAVQALYMSLSRGFDYRGRPGEGGRTLTELHKNALAAVVLSGSTFFKFRRLSRREQRQSGLPIPLQLQLIHRERLDETKNDDNTFYGIGVDGDGQVTGYWLFNRHPAEYQRNPKGSSTNSDSQFVSKYLGGTDRLQIGHLFVEEDIDQLDGVPWMATGIPTAQLRHSYEITEAEAAEAAACIVAGYRLGTGKTQLGLPNTDRSPAPDLTDTDGNVINRLQPKMFVNLGRDGELQMMSPNRGNSASGEFIRHMVSSEAAALPGTKASTLTLDYRRSSFSSERAADNDNWPEIEDVQYWFNQEFSQVVYEEIILTAVEDGYFDGVEGFSVEDFNARRANYLNTHWASPFARSINPKDDEDAAFGRIKNGRSSPQREAAAINADWRDVVREKVEFLAFCAEQGLPEDIALQTLGIEQKDQPEDGEGGEGGEKKPPARKTESEQDKDMEDSWRDDTVLV